MNAVASLLAAALLSAVPLAAQDDATLETTPTAAQAARTAQRKLDAERRAQKILEEKPLVYGGFLHDLRKAEKKSKFFSLRRPKDPATDYQNLYFDERTARPKGFVLFSIGF